MLGLLFFSISKSFSNTNIFQICWVCYTIQLLETSSNSSHGTSERSGVLRMFLEMLKVHQLPPAFWFSVSLCLVQTGDCIVILHYRYSYPHLLGELKKWRVGFKDLDNDTNLQPNKCQWCRGVPELNLIISFDFLATPVTAWQVIVSEIQSTKVMERGGDVRPLFLFSNTELLYLFIFLFFCCSKTLTMCYNMFFFLVIWREKSNWLQQCMLPTFIQRATMQFLF